jgi:hypothetical protein
MRVKDLKELLENVDDQAEIVINYDGEFCLGGRHVGVLPIYSEDKLTLRGAAYVLDLYGSSAYVIENDGVQTILKGD